MKVFHLPFKNQR